MVNKPKQEISYKIYCLHPWFNTQRDTANSRGPTHIFYMTGGSEGFFWVWHFGQKGFFWVYERRRDFFGSRKQHRDFFGYFFSSAQINNSISAIYSFVFDQNQSWSWHVLAFQKINNKICWCKNTEGFFWVDKFWSWDFLGYKIWTSVGPPHH